jgi:hypothetical protein
MIFLIIFVCFLSLFIGSYLAYETEEELKPGRRYFLVAKILVVYLIFSIGLSKYLGIFSYLLAILPSLYVIRHRIFWITSALLVINTVSLPIIASLIFFLGLIEGTLSSKVPVEKSKPMLSTFYRLLKVNILFLIIGCSALFI